MVINMAACNMSRDSRVNMFSSTLKLHTNGHTVRGRTTLKDVERFRNGSNHMRYRELYERTFMSELSIENHAISNKISTELSNMDLKAIHKNRRLSIRNREPSRVPIRTMDVLRTRACRMVRMLVYERIRLTTPKSSKLYCYVKDRKQDNKVRFILKCKLTERFSHHKIKSKRTASQYLSLFSCNKLKCLYKTRSHAVNYCEFKLSRDIEKNPGPTPVYIDPSNTVAAPYSQGYELIFGQNAGKQCVAMSLCSLKYHGKKGINSANDLIAIMNIGNQLYSSLSQLARQSYLMLTELPTMLNMFDANYQLHYSESYLGTVHQETAIQGYQYCTSWQKAFESLISEDYKNFILTVGCIVVAWIFF